MRQSEIKQGGMDITQTTPCSQSEHKQSQLWSLTELHLQAWGDSKGVLL